MLTAFLGLNIFGDLYISDSHRMTAFYALFIFAGLFNCFSARCERFWLLSNIGKNKPFILIMLFISTIQILIIYFGGELFRSTPLLPEELGYAVSAAALVLAFDIIRRVFKKLSRG